VAVELEKSPVVAASSLGARALAMLPMLAPKTAQRGKATDGFRSKTPEAAPLQSDVPKPALVRQRSSSAPAEPERIVDSMTGEVVAVAVTAVPTSEQKRQRPKFARGESRV
jgi:hypothetical protein